jgi:phospholipid/cholesterol/gamma-HCH transport system substrate-binding protein
VTQTLRDVAGRADELLRQLSAVVGENQKPLNEIMVNLKAFTDTLDRKAVAVDEILANAKNFTAALDRNSDRLDKIMANVESMTDADTKKELLDTVRSVRVLAENLDKRTAEISAGLTKFTGSGLREWEQLAVDGRKTLAQLDRAVRNLDRNPSRVLFGGSGSSVPEYNGRR